MSIFTSPGIFVPWTPVFGAVAGMTFTGVSIQYARYALSGNNVFFYLRATGTTGGVAGIYITFSLPIGKALNVGIPITAASVDNAIVRLARGAVGIGADPTVGLVVQQNAGADANWGLGAGRQILAEGFYELG